MVIKKKNYNGQKYFITFEIIKLVNKRNENVIQIIKIMYLFSGVQTGHSFSFSA